MPKACSSARSRGGWLASCALAACAPAAFAAELSCPRPGEAVANAEWQELLDSDPLDQRIDISSDSATLAIDGNASLQGDVRVRQGNREIRAQDMRYDARARAFEVDGAVEYRDPIVRVLGNDGEYSAAEGATFKAAEFELRERAARGEAAGIELTPGGVIELDDVSFTSCPLEEPAWRLRAGSITLDTTQRLGTARNARVEFKRIPILYLPRLSFPLGDERKSGFLFPSVGTSSRSGAQLALPYYWNVAPNADATLAPTLYSRRGVNLGGEVRYLTRANGGELFFNYLPSDRLFEEDRSRVHLEHVTELPRTFRFAIDAANVSDDFYFEDFGTGPEGTSVPFLERLARLSYRDRHWLLAGELQHYQTIERTLLEAEHPYARVPRLVADADFGLGESGWFRYGIQSEVVNFQRDLGVTGWRLDASPGIALDLNGAGWFFRPSAAWRHTEYSLEDVTPGAPEEPSRSLPIAMLDTGLAFERPSGRNGSRRTTFEPRVQYVYIPFRAQDGLPLFDTAVPDLNIAQLFRANRYVGADRVGDANQVSVGATTRLLDAATGGQFLHATLSQTFYFDPPRVQIPGETLSTRSRSDVIAQLGVAGWRHWNLDFALQWDLEETRSERAQAQVQYRPAPDSVVNLGYSYQHDRLDQVEGSAAWPLGRRWSLYARLVQSLRDDTSIERFAGFEYRACCWRVRLVGRRAVSSRTGEQDSGIYLQLELTGLASVGSSADAFLEGAIRGYSRTPASL